MYPLKGSYHYSPTISQKKKKSGFLLNYFSFLKLGNTQFYVFLGKTLNHNFTQVTYIVDLSQISNVNMAS